MFLQEEEGGCILQVGAGLAGAFGPSQTLRYACLHALSNVWQAVVLLPKIFWQPAGVAKYILAACQHCQQILWQPASTVNRSSGSLPALPTTLLAHDKWPVCIPC